ncbi:MAG TPA: cyclic peptide export ABC transporter, partial [Gammaproteobacteria bacterium]|nr:cyclic peptide export ABC transporter [Gammaproteobacteria bacterium]
SIQNRKIKDTIREARTAQVQYGEMLRDMINGFKELKVNYVKRENFHDDLGSISSRFRKLNIGVTRLQTITYLTTQIFMFGLIAVVIFVLPQYSQLDRTVMFQFFAAILFLIGPLETLVGSYQKITRANISYEQVTEFEAAINKHASEVVSNEYRTGTIEFNEIRLEAVCFQYRTNRSDDYFVTGPINLTIQRGDVLFIIGGNGTGKTTLLKLIAGLYTPTSGDIYIDGKKLVLENQQEYRELFTTIFTDFHIFSKVYGYDEVEADTFSQWMKDLNLEGKTSIVDGALTTRELSRGQKKRLAYLISLIDNRDIYVFDEFAADQDPNFKRYFYYTILPELKALGKTVIAVTHDDNYFDACDRLIKMDNGQLVDIDDNSKDGQQQKIVND